ncbi:LacI family DNA-binding transcriptional regulator [Microbacterium sp. VKM Ac-2923]|uniref:LacI family DNA-binding transcriptional regulator n=1 Tax=Microbacterium sp. VKM Ac-2923 TaxID=2929476 RepID=UPI001FB367B4|nr:LacI family DNA-binding transcriptional regulator [Microbacterium sp. VKM Ac-2923]MCJ1706127.1 LacI family DNA-binding transcriptional regulator [Microbacterium sp. VKM Ac-2923]
MTRVRLTDVAKAAGVSPATVSLVLNDAESRISAETKERVRRVADEVGYSPNPIARSLRTRVTGTIGLVSDRIATTPFAGRMLAGAQEVARENGRLVILVDTDGHPEIESDAISTLVNHRVDGMVYASMYHRVIPAPAGLPAGTVFLDCRPEDGGYPAVVPDDYAGGRVATQELVDAGHRRIAYIDNDEDRPVAAELRLRGYLDVLAESGIEPDPALHVFSPTSAAGGQQAAADLFALEPAQRPTGIFAYNDRIAAGVVTWAHRHGIRIPEDLSIVGYDDQQLVASELDPPLTTVSLPHAAMGRWAMEVALGLREADTESPHLMDCPIVRRASVGPPAHLGSARDPRVAD